MVVLELGDQISVSVESGENKPFAYTVFSNGEEVVGYETSADIRLPSGRTSVRNIVYQRTSATEKEEIGHKIQEELNRHEEALNKTIGRSEGTT